MGKIGKVIVVKKRTNNSRDGLIPEGKPTTYAVARRQLKKITREYKESYNENPKFLIVNAHHPLIIK